MNPSIKNKLVPLAVLIAVLATVGFTWTQMRPKGPGSAFILSLIHISEPTRPY